MNSELFITPDGASRLIGRAGNAAHKRFSIAIGRPGKVTVEGRYSWQSEVREGIVYDSAPVQHVLRLGNVISFVLVATGQRLVFSLDDFGRNAPNLELSLV